LYCDVERTGSASQFYDRLNARHELSSILVFLWTDRPGHKESIVSYWDLHPDNFKSFADKLLNDSIFLLDEGLSKLFESRGAQSRLDAGLITNDVERREAVDTMERGARQTRSFMVLLRESLRIFSMVALNHPRLFMVAEMHERLATSLNYCLYQIHGPRRTELRLSNPEKYEFDPSYRAQTGSSIGISTVGFRSNKYTINEWHENHFPIEIDLKNNVGKQQELKMKH